MIKCDYLGAAASNDAFESATGDVEQYIQDPFRWPQLIPGQSSSKRLIYTRWTWSPSNALPYAPAGEDVLGVELGNLIYAGRLFPRPKGLYRSWVNSVVHTEKFDHGYAECILEPFTESKDGHLVAVFKWPGVYEDADFTIQYYSKVLVSNLLRDSRRRVPGNPTQEHMAQTLFFSEKFYHGIAKQLGIRFAGVFSPLDRPMRPQGPDLVPFAPATIHDDSVWILKSGKAIIVPARDLVLRRNRSRSFGDDVIGGLEKFADHFYKTHLGIQQPNQRCNTRDRHLLAAVTHGFFGCLGVQSRGNVDFAKATLTASDFQSEVWSKYTWEVPVDDATPCWWITNPPFEEPQVLI